MTIKELKQTAVEVRKGIVTATHAAKSGHPGGSLSATEIFTYLYFEEMNICLLYTSFLTKTDLLMKFIQISKQTLRSRMYSTALRHLRKRKLIT